MMLYIFIAIILLIYLYFKKQYLQWKNLGFPYLEPTFPFGNIYGIGFREHLGEFVKREYDKFKNKGPAFGIYILANPTLILTDPELIKDVLIRHFEYFHAREFYVNEKADPLWKNLFTSSGQEWKDLRAKLSPTFTSGRIKMMFPIVIEAADRMVKFLKQQQETVECFEIKEVYASYTTEVIANVAFGLDIKCLGHPENEFRKVAKMVFEPSSLENLKNFMLFTMPKIGKFFNLSLNPKFVTDFLMKTVKENLEYRETNNFQRNDFFQLLINIKNSGIGMTFDEIAANSFLFFSAAFETSSSAMTFCTYELALNQDVQDRVRAEIEKVIEKHHGELTYDGIMEMKYLNMVLNEALRKYPVLDTHLRKSVKDYKIPNTNLVIPAGTAIMVPVIGIHNDERFHENPEKFDPERFTEENVKKRNPMCFMPFSEGPRICIGLRFGKLQTKIGLIKLLRNFKILPSNKTLIPMKFSPNAGFQSPLGGMWIKIESINKV